MTQGDRELIERFKGWSNQSVIAECRGQARGCLDPEYSAFMNETADRLQALSAEVERLREALEPFASIADLIESETEGFDDSDDFQLMFNDYLMERFSVRQFKEAHQALKGANNG